MNIPEALLLVFGFFWSGKYTSCQMGAGNDLKRTEAGHSTMALFCSMLSASHIHSFFGPQSPPLVSFFLLYGTATSQVSSHTLVSGPMVDRTILKLYSVSFVLVT